MIYTIIRIILGLLFVVSGWVKAIDPIGVSYKIADYATAFNVEWIGDMSMPLAVLLCAAELFIGLMLLFKLWTKTISYLTFLVLIFFTLITFYLVIVPDKAINECGCFGDAIILTNGQTFLKNIFFLILSFFYARKMHQLSISNNTKYYYSTSFMSIRKKRQLKTLRFFVYLYLLLFSIAIPLYSALYLPPYTYLPFDIGTNLRENKHIDEEIETKLIYENIETGKRKTFAVEDSEWQDDTKWKYIDTETSGGSNTIAVTQLTLYNQNQENVTDTIIEDAGYTFMVVTQDIKDLEYTDITSLSNLYKMNEADKINLIVVTASPFETSKSVLSSYGWQNIDVYNADIVELKSVLRHHKGVILISDGTISGKWNFHQNIFKNIGYNDIKPLVDWEKNAINVYFIIIGIFLAIMLYLVRLYHTIRR